MGSGLKGIAILTFKGNQRMRRWDWLRLLTTKIEWGEVTLRVEKLGERGLKDKQFYAN